MDGLSLISLPFLKRIYQTKDMAPLEEYERGPRCRSRSVEFLRNLQELAEARFLEPLRVLEYQEHETEVHPANLTLHRRKGLRIRCNFLWNPEDSEIIFLAFHSSDNMAQELGVFRTLTEELSVEPLPVTEPALYTYWAVPGRLELVLSRTEIVKASTAEVLATCNRILASRRSG